MNQTANKSMNQSGISLIITFFVISLAVAVVLPLSTIFLTQFKLSQNLAYSTYALYAADSGIEQALYQDRQVAQFTEEETGSGIQGNGASFSWKVTLIGAQRKIISRGQYKAVSRAIEATY